MKPVLVVGVGGDIGVYAFQRAAHEQYGWQPVVLAPVMTTFMKHSTLVDYVITPGLHDPDVLVARLNDFAASHPDNELILFTNLDWHVRVIAERRAELDPRWLIPLCELSAFDRISSKTAFAAACDAVGVRTPRTVPVVFTRTDDAEAGQGAGAGAAEGTVHAAQAIDAIRTLGLEYPLIGKPSASADWFNASFPGKLKIHHFTSEAELTEVLDHLSALDYPSEFLVQEFVPGDETHMRSLTAYRDRNGDVTLLAGGQVLLEEHTPGTLGIPAAIVTGVDAEAFDAARRVLDHTDYFGFANFDYKVSSRDGSRVFFEANPRIGRNNYYVTASGANVADAVARDLLPEHYAANGGTAVTEPVTPHSEILYSLVSLRVLLRYILDPELRGRLRAVAKRHGVVHPLDYRADGSLKRRLWVRALRLRLAQMLRRYYPAPTETGF